jgi:hypothetical protein
VIPFTFGRIVCSIQSAATPRESGQAVVVLINMWLDPDVYAPGIVNRTMYE